MEKYPARESVISESTLGNYRDDETVSSRSLPDLRIIQNNNACQCATIKQELLEVVQKLKTELSVSGAKKYELTPEERRKMVKEHMLQLVESLCERHYHSDDEMYLFLKAIASGERTVNIKISYNVFRPSNSTTSEKSSFPNLPFCFDKWSIQFECSYLPESYSPESGEILEKDLSEFYKNPQKFTRISYRFVLTTPVEFSKFSLTAFHHTNESLRESDIEEQVINNEFSRYTIKNNFIFQKSRQDDIGTITWNYRKTDSLGTRF